jgi:glucose-1-phosphate thymidylyltransferase
MAWFDAGTHDSLLEAGAFVQAIQKRQGIHLACVEEIAYRMGFINAGQLALRSKRLSESSGYGRYVAELTATASA